MAKQPVDQPENLKKLLKQEQRDYDCTPCRVIGMFYLYREVILKSGSWLGMRGRKMGISGLSLGLAWMAPRDGVQVGYRSIMGKARAPPPPPTLLSRRFSVVKNMEKRAEALAI
ncbi:hypothetical protein VP1G_10826 [Cytospora mali]|uniref:DUF4536 domain-containing protein n=1 Tax=Cytospora mali TaxID=578113 RepID=A0A194UY12_CYTMA|nr:hypothetical protein VP1G_10826 [Valsa mali var. pyri (nom. inval.)]